VNAEPLAALAAGGKAALARALSRLETDAGAPATAALLDAAHSAPRGHAIGLTGPPGVGKSTLVDALIRHWRREGRTVGVIAVDPSSQRSKGALLGDRTRIVSDPDDPGVFVRSMAARESLGGVATITFPALVLMRALFDRVLVETVGVGQSETAISGICDTVVLCAQPASGDALQFMKAGVMEIPDIVLVTKGDIGPYAERTVSDLKGALSVTGGAVEVMACSAQTGDGIAAFCDAVAGRDAAATPADRAAQARAWFRAEVLHRFGTAGLAALRAREAAFDPARPFATASAIVGRLETAFATALRVIE